MPLSPTQFFQRRPLAGDVLIRWSEMIAYFGHLQAADERLSLETIGLDWSGLPMILLKLGPAEPNADRVAVAITAGVHAHELAGSQLMPDLLFELLTGGPEVSSILAGITLLVVPCINPGGLELIADWRLKTAGSPFNGTLPPGQTHPIGHDLNRDWIVQTQPETRAVVQRVFNRWRPQVVLDLHEMAPNGPRYALPPYIAPVDANIPAHYNAEAGRFGAAIARAMGDAGLTGVTTGLFFDGFSPARAYAPYHGGIRILAEAAGTRLGRAMHLSADELASAPNFDPRASSDRHPLPWPGGRWSLSDVAAYHRAAIMTTLHLSADLSVDVVAPAPNAMCFLVPPISMQRDPDAAWTLLETLRSGDVDVRRALQPFGAADVTFPAGTFVIDAAQPNWPWAKTLLEVQHYVTSDEALSRVPYDVTAQTLPLLMGVDVIALQQSVDAPSEPRGATPRPGHVAFTRTRVAIYQSKRPDASEAGWARTMLDDAGVHSHVLDDITASSGDLSQWDVIVLPHQEPDHLLNGLNLADYPQDVTGGIGTSGLMRLRRWVNAGGTLIVIDGACRALIDQLHFPIKIVPRNYLARGSILRVELDLAHDLNEGCERELAIMSVNSVVFDTERSDRTNLSVVARYPQDDPLLSGLLANRDGLAGQGAIVERRDGAGRFLLFSCRPLFRGQSLASRRLILNAIRHAGTGANR